MESRGKACEPDRPLHRQMNILRVRVGRDELKELDELAEDMHLSRSEVARTALREGMRRMRIEKALDRYFQLVFTLCRAAEYAGATIQEMAEAASARGIPFFRYSIEELRRDRERAAEWRRG